MKVQRLKICFYTKVGIIQPWDDNNMTSRINISQKENGRLTSVSQTVTSSGDIQIFGDHVVMENYGTNI